MSFLTPLIDLLHEDEPGSNGWRPHKRKALYFRSWSPSARQGIGFLFSKPLGVEVEGRRLKSASPLLVSRKACERKRCLDAYRCRKMVKEMQILMQILARMHDEMDGRE
ncbi:hypothetical protein EJB05_48660, partial [Eragrostis curvula]